MVNCQCTDRLYTAILDPLTIDRYPLTISYSHSMVAGGLLEMS